VPAGGTLQTDIQIPIDLTKKVTYNLIISIVALTQTGRVCRATTVTSFTAGYPLPPLFPTVSPTQAPTGTPPPTPDPKNTACVIRGDIFCSTESGRTCKRITEPDPSCNSFEEPTLVRFIYTGLPCSANSPDCSTYNQGLDGTLPEAYLIISGSNEVVFSGIVQPGQFVTINRDFERGFAASVYTAIGSNAGTLLQEMGISTDCDGDLLLLTQYGALQLSGFSNPVQGYQSAFELITMTYAVINEGVVTANILSADSSGGFNGATPIALLSTPLELAPGETHLIPTSTQLLYLFGEAGNTYSFDVTTTGEGQQSGRSCSDTNNYFFTITQ